MVLNILKKIIKKKTKNEIKDFHSLALSFCDFQMRM